MPSTEKLIKQGIQYTDTLFDEIMRRLEQANRKNDTLEAFLEATKEYTIMNPLTSTGFDGNMLNLILSETNNHKFSRPSQKELTRLTIKEYCGKMLYDLGEDVKEKIRTIAIEEYGKEEGSNPEMFSKRIRKEIGSIKNTRARTIARTEIARTSTVSDYIINKERGATHFVVMCRSTRCPVCEAEYCAGSLTGGDVEYGIGETEHLPPLHPNCRCVAEFTRKKE